MGCEGAGRDEVVVDSVIEFYGFGFADIDTDEGPGLGGVFGFEVGTGSCDAGPYCCGAIVVKSHAVNDGFIFDEAEKAGLRVPRLGLCSDGSDFNVTESEGSERRDCFAAFVEACGDAEG